MAILNKAVFLDRDGVLNKPIVRDRKPYAPSVISDFLIYPEAERALKKLRSRGFLLLVVTNQPDLATGVLHKDELDKMHNSLMNCLPITEIYVCPHSRRDDCLCRKPRSGLIEIGIKNFGLDVNSSWMIGDRYSDIVAGLSAGLNTIFIDRNYAETPVNTTAGYVVESLVQAVDTLLENTKLYR